MNNLQAINQIGIFSKKNMSFLKFLEKEGIKFEKTKLARKHTINIIGGCSVVFDYDELKIKTKGDCTRFLDQFIKI